MMLTLSRFASLEVANSNNTSDAIPSSRVSERLHTLDGNPPPSWRCARLQVTDTSRQLDRQTSAMHQFATTASEMFVTPSSSRTSTQLYTTQNYTRVEPPQWVTCSTPIKNEQFSPGRAVETQELIRNGLLPQLNTMQLMQMQGNSKRTKLELCPEDEQKRRIRREKNKIAAAKCRVKNREHSKNLKKDHEMLERQQVELREQLSGLQADVSRLEGLLASHKCLLSDKQKAEIEGRLEKEMKRLQPEVWKEDSATKGGDILVEEIQLDVGSSTERPDSEAEMIINSAVSSPSTIEG